MCDFCPKRFYKALDKKRHKLKHTGEKPYQCENCGQNFGGQSSVKKHAQICNGPGSKPRKEKQAKLAVVDHPGAYQQYPYNFSLPGIHFNAYK